MDELISIGEAARWLGVNPSALRYYESRGVIQPAARHHGERRYGRTELRRLAFIQFTRRLGMSVDDIGEFLYGAPDQWHQVARSQIAAMEDRIRQLETAKNYLGQALQCPSEHPVDECPHLGALLDRRAGSPVSAGEPPG